MLTTTRCLLNNPAQFDRDQLIRVYTDPRVRAFLGGPLDDQTAAARFNDLMSPTDLNHAWVIRDRVAGTLIGLVTIDPHHDGQDLELSYQILPEHQGLGYATEALTAVVEYAFTTLGLSRLVSETQTANKPSIRLLERIGMVKERTLVRFGAEQGVYCLEAQTPSTKKPTLSAALAN